MNIKHLPPPTKIIIVLTLVLMFCIIKDVNSQSYISTQTSSASGNIYHTGGYLGIGTIIPKTNIHIYNDTQFPKIRLEYKTYVVKENTPVMDSLKAPDLQYYWDTEVKYNDLIFSYGVPKFPYPTEKIRFSSSGNIKATSFSNTAGTFNVTSTGSVGIGTTSPLAALHIEKNYSEDASYISPNIILKENRYDGTNLHGWEIKKNLDVLFFTFNDYAGNSEKDVLLLGDNCVTIKTDFEISSKFKVTSAGNVTIGTNTASTSKLFIEGAGAGSWTNPVVVIKSTGDNAAISIKSSESNGTIPQNWIIASISSSTVQDDGFWIKNQSSGITPFKIENETNNVVIEKSLWVKEELIVDNVRPWGDYVFEPDYDLMSLSELENYVTTNKHLPEIPTATEITENGQNIGELNVLLVKKIEELTLYIIDLQKQIDELKTTKE